MFAFCAIPYTVHVEINLVFLSICVIGYNANVSCTALLDLYLCYSSVCVTFTLINNTNMI